MNNTRPCVIIDEEEMKAEFHCWEYNASVVWPSIMIGGHHGGQIAGICAIVEMEDGTVRRVLPEQIRFSKDKLDSIDEDGPEDPFEIPPYK